MPENDEEGRLVLRHLEQQQKLLRSSIKKAALLKPSFLQYNIIWMRPSGRICKAEKSAPDRKTYPVRLHTPMQAQRKRVAWEKGGTVK